MLWILKVVGSRKIFLPVAIALVVILISYTMIQYGKNTERLQNTVEIQQEYIETRKNIDEAVKATPTDNAAAALDWLRNRQATKP